MGSGRVQQHLQSAMHQQDREKSDARGKDDHSSSEADTTENFHVRLATSSSEVSLLLEWGAAEGWNPGVYDAESYIRQDPKGCYLAELDGVPIGGVLAVKYGDDLAGMGHLIVKPPFRGKGYAYKMATEVMKKTGDRNLFQESATHLQNIYERVGFVGSWQTTRFRGAGHDAVLSSTRAEDPVTLVSVNKVKFEDLCAFDQKVFGAPRPAFLTSWIKQPGLVGLVAIEGAIGTNSNDGASKIVGYGCIRLSYESYKDVTFSRKIGPIFAESSAVGSQLFKSLVATVPTGIPFYIDVIETNEGAMQLVKELGLESVFQTTRMFTKGNYGVQESLIYGQTTLEIG